MNQFIIHLPTAAYVSDDFGEFCVQLGEYYFPSKAWTDFGERVIFNWADELNKLLTGESKKVRCKFMDGNYRLDVETANSKETLNIEFIRDARDIDDVKHQENVNLEQFFQEILRVIKTIQEECKKNNNFEAVDRIQLIIDSFLKAKGIFLDNK